MVSFSGGARGFWSPVLSYSPPIPLGTNRFVVAPVAVEAFGRLEFFFQNRACDFQDFLLRLLKLFPSPPKPQWEFNSQEGSPSPEGTPSEDSVICRSRGLVRPTKRDETGCRRTCFVLEGSSTERETLLKLSQVGPISAQIESCTLSSASFYAYASVISDCQTATCILLANYLWYNREDLQRFRTVIRMCFPQ